MLIKVEDSVLATKEKQQQIHASKLKRLGIRQNIKIDPTNINMSGRVKYGPLGTTGTTRILILI